MDVLEVEIRYGLTLNLGNFESERIDMGIKVMLTEPGDTEEKAIEKYFPWLKRKCHDVRQQKATPRPQVPQPIKR